MKMLINNGDFIFAEENSPYRCISILIAEGKFFNLFPLYLVHKIVNVLLGGGTFNEDIYIFKEDNFKVVLITKSMHFYSQEDKNICESLKINDSIDFKIDNLNEVIEEKYQLILGKIEEIIEKDKMLKNNINFMKELIGIEF